jgi:translation elongation factor EF-Tu-like GTPase
MVMPGDNVRATFELISPVAIDPGEKGWTKSIC